MKIELSTRIEAPPPVVFRFFAALDHLRFISTDRRQEWCPDLGVVASDGLEAEVKIRQGGRAISLRFRVVRFETDRLMEDEFLSWPLRGAVHRHAVEPADGGRATLLSDVNDWSPPWYLRGLVERHVSEQARLFERRHENAKRLIEAVYAARGDDAFREGIFPDAERVGIAPVIPVEDGRSQGLASGDR